MTVLLSIAHLLNRQQRTFNMQTSITKFFKTKQPTQEEHDSGKESPADLAPSKRRAEDNTDTEMSKRLAVSPPHSTPTKATEDNKSLTKPMSVLTPAKNTVSQEGKNSVPSPLIDLNIVIRKVIANGSHALHENIGKSWFRALQAEFGKPYFKKLSAFVVEQRQVNVVYPPENKVYSWTHHHDIRSTRVIILGQDPYHGPNQAHGLSFSVQKGVRIPPSLINIYKELENDISGFKSTQSGDLTGWAKQGVLMLNTCLTVNQGQANSHQGKGWETFTDAVISWLSKNLSNKVVFLLWGSPAQRKASMIDKRHKILTAVHPSPLSAHRGFFGCRHFSQTNTFLKSQGLPEIDWKAL